MTTPTVTFDADLDRAAKADYQYELEARSVSLAEQGLGSHPLGNTVARDRAHTAFLSALDVVLKAGKADAFGTYRLAFRAGTVTR